jgi:hypothetical protein
MTLAIMQPYLFPYIGYFQLVNAADKFVVYDDVTFRKKGWINRNKILVNGSEVIFTVPLKNASSFVTIGQTEINKNLYENWKANFFKTLAMTYAKAPQYKRVFDLVTSVFNESHNTISSLATSSIVETCKYIGIDTDFIFTSSQYKNNDLKSQERVIDICKIENASTYINAIGGKELYSKDDFAKFNISLKFVQTRPVKYHQFNDDFIPWLSIIDIMMFNEPKDIRSLLCEYDLN